MLTFIASCFRKVMPCETLEFVESKSASNFIYRDELRKKKSPSKQKCYHGDSFSSAKPLLILKDHEKDPKFCGSTRGFDGKARTTVKLKMTKQEAARLLSRCKDGGILDFKDVARELVDLPMNRITVVSPCPASNSVLDVIPEEC